MPLRSVTHLPLAEVADMMPSADTAVLLIRDPGTAPNVHPGWGQIMHMEFIGLCYGGLLASMPRPDLWKLGPVFTEDLALAIRHFTHQVDASPTTHLVVACHEGLSRSAAIAEWVSDHFGAVWNNPVSRVNPLVLSLLEQPDRFRTYFGPPLLPSLGLSVNDPHKRHTPAV
jgi:hypothetical protein